MGEGLENVREAIPLSFTEFEFAVERLLLFAKFAFALLLLKVATTLFILDLSEPEILRLVDRT